MRARLASTGNPSRMRCATQCRVFSPLKSSSPAQLAKAYALSILQLQRSTHWCRLSSVSLSSMSAVAHDDASAAPAEEAAATSPRQRLGKRKVALFIGYEGTAYRGLQSQKHASQEDDSIEATLKQAIFLSGGILPTNMDSAYRLKWGRSSRTDKRVHSLATVISLMLECDPESFDADPDGIGIAARINERLPSAVRVFSVQRVNKGFNARSECLRRTYYYHVPASLLGLACDGGEGDAAKLALLTQAWGMFQGNRPFHNYTRRRLYRTSEAEQRKQKKGARAAAAAREESEASEEEEEEGEAVGSGSETTQPGVAQGDEEGGEGAGSAVANPNDWVANPQLRGRIVLDWKGEIDAADAVGMRHYRFCESCTVSPAPVTLIAGGTPCVRLSVRGASFMLHQIRHMVGAAVAVTLGRIPLGMLEASLSAPARVSLPLAPPCTLVLSDAEFSPFRTGWDPSRPAEVTKWSGAQLELRPAGQAQRDAFAADVLLPAMDGLLRGEEWEEWRHELERMWFDPGELATMLEEHKGWRVRQVERSELRRQRREEGRAAEQAAAAEQVTAAEAQT